MLFLDDVQNLDIHAVRAKILLWIFEPEGRCWDLTSAHRPYYAVDKEVQESAEIGPIPASALRPKID